MRKLTPTQKRYALATGAVALMLPALGLLPHQPAWAEEFPGDRPGIFRPDAGDWILTSHLDGTDEEANTDDVAEDAVAITGDWDGDGSDEVGLWIPATKTFKFYTTGSPSPGEEPMLEFAVESAKNDDLPLSGDWLGDGSDRIGLYRPGTDGNEGWVSLNWQLDDKFDKEYELGVEGDVPVVGDWTGDGKDTIGLRRGSDWLITDDSGGNVSVRFGNENAEPVVGDWNDDGKDTIGVRENNVWRIKESNTAGGADASFRYGTTDDQPVVGKWGADAATEPVQKAPSQDVQASEGPKPLFELTAPPNLAPPNELGYYSLPPVSEPLFTYLTANAECENYGSWNTIATVYTAASRFVNMYPETPLMVGDINGPSFVHNTHHQGADVDISVSHLSGQQQVELAMILADIGTVEGIHFNNAAVRDAVNGYVGRADFMTYVAGHDTHFHIDVGPEDLPPWRPCG